MRTLAKVRALSLRDWRGIARAYGYLVEAGWRVFVRREKLFPWLNGGDLKDQSPLPAEHPEMQRVLRQARYVNLTARHPIEWARCLQRSVALCLWLDRQGLRPVLRLGVARNGDRLEAHAWVEYRGVVINDDPTLVAAAFAPLEHPAHKRQGTSP
jgi:hypothetical protein